MGALGDSHDGGASEARNHAHVVALMLSWYVLGMGLVYVNKFMLSEEKFSFPFITVLATNLLTWLIALFLSTIGAFRPPSISWTLFKRQAIPTGICTGLDIGIANWSLQHLNVTFFTMIRGTIPSFVLVFSMCFDLEVVEPLRIYSTLTVCIGIVLASMGEVQFHLPGVLMCVLSCMIAGARWVFVELMMAKPLPRDVDGAQRASVVVVEGTSPFGTILLVTPVTVCACLPFALVFELHAFMASVWVADAWHRRHAMAYLAAVTLLSFLLTLSKFHLVRATSSLDMSLMGILKQLLTIFGAVALFGDQLSWVRALGFITCSCGLGLYNVAQIRSQRAIVGDGALDAKWPWSAKRGGASAMDDRLARHRLIRRDRDQYSRSDDSESGQSSLDDVNR